MIITPVIVLNLIILTVAVAVLVADKIFLDYGECKIIINKEKELAVEGGGDLLGYLTRNNIYIPSACGGKATCGHCKVKVLSGAGNILPTEEVYVTPQEEEAGFRLACQVKVKNDLEVAIPEHILEAGEFQVKVEEIIQLTHDIKHFKFNIKEGNFDFKPGQYIQIKVPGTDEFRAYSIASVPSQKDSLELIVRLVPGGLCSTYLHKVLSEGDELTLTGPFGHFFLQEDSDNDIICIGGGCGMAPIRSIIYHLAEKGMPRRLFYFFGARSKRDLFFTEEFRKLEQKYSNFKYIPALSDPKASDHWEGDVGLITNVVEKYIDDASEFELYYAPAHPDISSLESYLCGPPPMIDAAMSVLTKKGIKEKNIFFDKF